MTINKLTINYKKSCYMIIGKSNLKIADFKLTINYNLINLENNVKYLGVHLNNKLTWKTHIDSLCKKLSKVVSVRNFQKSVE